jgi:hypothetical protein
MVNAAALQLAAAGTRRSPRSDLLPQRLAAFSASKLALSFAMETRFVSVDG